MDSLSAISAYKSHDLNIKMKTSSGDVIKLDFSNEESLSYASAKDGKNSAQSMKFSSMQSFSFSYEGDGIDEQDKAEIEAFMKVAQPYIDNFLEELDDGSNTTPVNKIAKDISSAFSSIGAKDDNTKNYAKSSIVDMFDKSLQQTKNTAKEFDKLFEEAQKLLEKTLYYLDNPDTNIYA